jgi:hypothetical protein
MRREKQRVWEISFTELVQHIRIPGVTAAIVGAVKFFGAHQVSCAR